MGGATRRWQPARGHGWEPDRETDKQPLQLGSSVTLHWTPNCAATIGAGTHEEERSSRGSRALALRVEEEPVSFPTSPRARSSSPVDPSAFRHPGL